MLTKKKIAKTQTNIRNESCMNIKWIVKEQYEQF